MTMTPCRTLTASLDERSARNRVNWKKNSPTPVWAAEMVAPRLWFDPPQRLTAAHEQRSQVSQVMLSELRSAAFDVANHLGNGPDSVLWFAREGQATSAESKTPVAVLDYLSEALDRDCWRTTKKSARQLSPKPNEPMDHAYIPTSATALAIAQQHARFRNASAA